MDAIDQDIINRLQQGFPISERPYAEVANILGISEDELLQRLQDLLNSRLLTRFGPMYHAERLGGGLTLAAMSIPEKDFRVVTDIVNSYPEVAHNYQRDHRLNMWFVLATEIPGRIAEVIADIENKTGYTVYNMPKEEEFFVGLKLEA